jgi:meiotic recombination protein SPO11
MANLCLKGKGYPDFSTRRMVRNLADSLRIPVLALVDGDPYGIDILLAYKFGTAVSLEGRFFSE